MKLQQTDQNLIARSNGIGSALLGSVFAVIGVAIIVAGFSSKSSGGQPQYLFASIGAVMLLVGAIVIYTSKNRQVSITKGGDTTISTKKIIGGGSAEQSVPTANIVGVRLLTTRGSSNTAGPTNTAGNSNLQRVSHIYLVLNDNSLIEVGSSQSGGGFNVNGINVSSLISAAPLSKEAHKIADFLGLPLQAIDEGNVIGAFRDVAQGIGQGLSLKDATLNLVNEMTQGTTTSPQGNPASPLAQSVIQPTQPTPVAVPPVVASTVAPVAPPLPPQDPPAAV